MKLPAYPSYKPSGVEWLGDVPEHWEAFTLRRASTRYAGGTPDRSNDSFWETQFASVASVQTERMINCLISCNHHVVLILICDSVRLMPPANFGLLEPSLPNSRK